MFMTIFIILLALWFLGIVSGVTLANYVHLLLLIALVMLAVRVIRGQAV